MFHSKAVSTLHSSSSPSNYTLFIFSINSLSKLLSFNLFLLDVSINPAILKSRSTGADEGSAVKLQKQMLNSWKEVQPGQ